MIEIKTRIEAKAACVEKWAEIHEKVLAMRELVDDNCGFCFLAERKKRAIYNCTRCEPDAQRLCEEYVTGETEKSIIIVIRKMGKLVVELKDKIINLPDVLKEE